MAGTVEAWKHGMAVIDAYYYRTGLDSPNVIIALCLYLGFILHMAGDQARKQTHVEQPDCGDL